MKTIGMVGLGIMGAPMARNLLAAGYPLVVWNRDHAKCEPLADKGAAIAASPREVAARADVTVAMVADPEAALAVALGPDGVVAGLGPGKGYVDCSTVDPATPIAIAAAVAEVGARFVEAPVSGSKKPAEDGTLIFLCAGDEMLYAECGPLWDVCGKMSVYLGAVGNGARMKLVVNMVMGTMVAALGEGLTLAQGAGLDAGTLLDVLDQGVMSNPLFRLKGPAMAAGEIPTAFPLKHQQKDLRLATSLGDASEVPLPVASAANQLFVRARAMGLGEADMGAVIRALRT